MASNCVSALVPVGCTAGFSGGTVSPRLGWDRWVLFTSQVLQEFIYLYHMVVEYHIYILVVESWLLNTDPSRILYPRCFE